MFQNKNKGFTIVELVIVIAVVAILAAVLIPTFAGLIEKANLSNDQQVITNMNKTLAIEFPDGKPASAGEAISALMACGFYGDKLDAYSKGYHYAYNLAENKFYLLNNDNKAVYPAECNSDELWGLYGNYNSDFIEGITKYVATTSITDANYFSVFNEGTYTIDLNDNVITVDSPNKSNITLLNGTTTRNGYKADSNSNVEAMNKLEITGNSISGAEAINGKVIELSGSYSITSANSDKEIVIEDCVFMGNDVESTLTVPTGTTLIIRNCKFVDQNKKFAVTIYGSTADVVIQNNEFINCTRGINFNYFSGNVVIEGNTFKLKEDSKGKNNCIQLADTNATLEIKNNKFENATAAIVINNVYIVGNYNSTITFSNNTLGENVQSVIADPDYKNELAAELQPKMEDCVQAFKNLFK